ncbi:tetratricopeptide repeat protein [Cobetia amphilecti]|uniref:tetratricopeptide repeat protein n=2 Tax=Cobetia TaxID=204286 RepID=UPI002449F4BF|nr:hypothetical protein [Cobetia litoralis]MDH2421056.1 hypothetical protein [Cobetia litoralis]
MATPSDWFAPAHATWSAGQRHKALQQLIEHFNQRPRPREAGLFKQISYYLFLLADYRSASQILAQGHVECPADEEIALNQVVCLSRANDAAGSLAAGEALAARGCLNPVLFDSLASSAARLKRHDEAREHGSRALALKDEQHGGLALAKGWRLPAESPSAVAAGKTRVLSFGLWGKGPRYLNGMLHNLLLAPVLYPGWRVRLYHDDSVPDDFLALARELDAELIERPSSDTLRQRLCWRFAVADDPTVGYFVVRDCDSVISLREVRAVQMWLTSGRFFHVMRDWWSHTDLVLAGLWGGVAGVLPPLETLLAQWQPQHVETPNIDQWFMKECVWRYLRESLVSHDRCYSLQIKGRDSLKFPDDVLGEAPGGTAHVGSDEWTRDRAFQLRQLGPWLKEASWMRDSEV